MTDNSILAQYNNIQIYQSDIDLYCQEYIDNLPDEQLIYKTPTFTGLLEYLYRKVIKNIVVKSYSGYDFKVLDNIFYNIYIPLTGKYGFTPTVIQFCTLVKIDNANISDIKNGVYRTSGIEAKKEKTQVVKKWYNTCESALLSRAVDTNSIGSIFALKSVYQYNDSQTIRIEQDTTPTHESAAEISARYASALLPEKPQLDE